MRLGLQKSCVLFSLIIVTSAQAQVDTLISYDVRTKEVRIIVPQFVDHNSIFDYTPWMYGSESGLSALNLVAPADPFPGAGFTDYKPAHDFFPVSDFPARTSVKLLLYKGDTLDQVCSGTLVGRDMVLTSSHCLYGYFGTAGVHFADSILAVPAFDNSMYNPNFEPGVSALYYLPKINLAHYIAKDIALIKLRQPIALKTGWLGIAFAQVDTFFQNNVFHKFSYPGTTDVFDSTRIFNGDTLYYNYGTLDLIEPNFIGFNIYGIPGQSGSSLFYTDNTRFYALGTLAFAFSSRHTRITRGLFYSFRAAMDDVTTYVGNDTQEPTRFSLANPYPNPFNPATIIQFSLPVPSFVVMRVYDLLGRQVTTLQNGFLHAGTHRVTFDGHHLPSGTYVIRLQANEAALSKKAILVK